MAWTAEQRRWIRANWPGDRRRIPTRAEAAAVLGRPLPEVADVICHVVTPREMERMVLEARRDDLQRAADAARRAREDAWAGFYEGE